MPCYHPLVAFKGKTLHPKSGKPIVYVFPEDSDKCVKGAEFFRVPCGRCIGCRLERSRQWAMRCVHEASLYDNNCFITLTFNDSNLPANGSLDKSLFPKFMKRLRKKFGSGVRYFHCGEYGSMLNRPHYHACLFNFDFADKVLWSVRDNVRLYRSASLESLWSDPVSGVSLGFSTIGDVTFESAAYVARYCVKKITGMEASRHYKGLTPEYVTMSRRPGIGSDWFKKWSSDVFPLDHVIVRGKECKPARFYDNIFCLTNPDEFAKIKEQRKLSASSNVHNKIVRLISREIVQTATVSNFRRDYETNRL